MESVVGSLGWAVLVGLTYLVSRFTAIVQALDVAFQDYGGTCAHEHSLYDVEASYRQLRILRRVYWVSMVLVYYACVSR